MGTLFIVSTPIGNLQDISLRGIHVLQQVDVIACEDTRRTGILLQSLMKEVGGEEVKKRNAKLVSYFEHNEIARISEILNFLRQGFDVALVSDAGTPAVSDPGFKLIRACIAEGIEVESVPGASAVLSALVVSGLPTDKFMFLGYFPRKETHLRKLLEGLTSLPKELNHTAIFFEAPHRILKTLGIIYDVFGSEQEIVLARELTKIHEEVVRKTVGQILDAFQKKTPKGEFVVMIHIG